MKTLLNEYKICKTYQPCLMYIPALNLFYHGMNTDNIVYIIKQKVKHQFLFFVWYTYRKVKVWENNCDNSGHYVNDYGYITLSDCNYAIDKLKSKQWVCIG